MSSPTSGGSRSCSRRSARRWYRQRQPPLAAGRSVLASCNQPLTYRDAWCCYGLGSLANTFLPGRLGEGIRIELFSRRVCHERQRWLACGVSAAVGLGQSLVLGFVLSLGAA